MKTVANVSTSSGNMAGDILYDNRPCYCPLGSTDDKIDASLSSCSLSSKSTTPNIPESRTTSIIPNILNTDPQAERLPEPQHLLEDNNVLDQWWDELAQRGHDLQQSADDKLWYEQEQQKYENRKAYKEDYNTEVHRRRLNFERHDQSRLRGETPGTINSEVEFTHHSAEQSEAEYSTSSSLSDNDLDSCLQDSENLLEDFEIDDFEYELWDSLVDIDPDLVEEYGLDQLKDIVFYTNPKVDESMEETRTSEKLHRAHIDLWTLQRARHRAKEPSLGVIQPPRWWKDRKSVV